MGEQPRPPRAHSGRPTTISAMIDHRLQALLSDTTAPIPEPDTATVPEPLTDEDTRAALINLAAEYNPAMAPIAEAATSELRITADGTLTASPALRAAMRSLVPGRDKAPAGAYRAITGWLTADTTDTAPVTATSDYFTVSHWHWMAAKDLIRRMPAELGPTFPHLCVSEAQIIHDLKAWSALDGHGRLTGEATEMFGAVTGYAELTVYGTVLLYAPATRPCRTAGGARRARSGRRRAQCAPGDIRHRRRRPRSGVRAGQRHHGGLHPSAAPHRTGRRRGGGGARPARP